MERRESFDQFHPAVVFAFLACAVAFSMAAMQPVYVALSCVGALACSCVCRGARASAHSLAWALPLVVVVAVANMIFSASGTTELFRFGGRAFYAEALAYGLCSGGMLAGTLLWFSTYATCMGSERSTALFGRVAPTVSLMVSQVMRLVPQFVRRGRSSAAVQDAVAAAAPQSRRQAVADRFRIVSVLMGWGMEDGLLRSDAMRARGYGCDAVRTTYRRYYFGCTDAVALAVVVLLAAINAFLATVACSQFSFYPAVSSLVFWWGYAVYVLFLLLPVAAWVKEWALWRSLR